MALGRDGKLKNSASYMPYDSSNSFVKKMAKRVTGLIGWRTPSQSVVSQNHDDLSSSADEDSVSPTPKRMRVECEEDDTLLKFIPNTSKAMKEACSPIPPVNDINSAGPSHRNKCIVSSTPANIYSSTSKNISTPKQFGTKHQSHNSDVTDHPEHNESVNYSLTIPQYDIHQRHNVTVPAISKDVPSQMSTFDSSKLSGSFSVNNTRRPSFNVDVFSTSSKQLSLSVCENRNLTSLSPFYSARTMYGGASALLPYGNQTANRMRSASTSKLNLFSPRSQITIQPVPSPSKANDQETMSAAARRILDTLEKYCSPVMDAKRIPVSESSMKAIESDSSAGPSRGMKRKLPALSQLMPSTTDLLRIKRKEKMQDSVSSARQTVSTVPESSFALDDDDSSSDSADLDYSVLKDDLRKASSQEYIGRIRRKEKIDDTPLKPIQLPNAVLKISNLPTFDITDTFTFSKPLLLENLEQSVADETPAPSNDSARAKDGRTSLGSKSTPSSAVATATTAVENSPKSSSGPTVASQMSKPLVGVPTWSFGSGLQSPQPSSGKPFVPNNAAISTAATIVSPFTKSSPSAKKTAPWICKVCHLESTDQSCSSCSSSRETNTKPFEPPKPAVTAAAKPEAAVAAGKSPVSGKDDTAFKSPTKTVGSFKPAVSSTPSAAPSSGSDDPWKKLQKSAASTWKCDECWVQNQLSEVSCVSCGTPAKNATKAKSTCAVDAPEKSNDGTPTFFKNAVGTPASVTSAAATATFKTPAFTFGSSNAASGGFSLTASSSVDNTPKPVPPPTLTFGIPNTKTTAAPAVTASFTFGIKSPPKMSEPSECNAIGTKLPAADVSAASTKTNEKSTEGKGAPVAAFNDVSNVTKSPLLKPAAAATSSEVKDSPGGLFPVPKFGTLKSPAVKENGEETVVANSVFNDVGPAANNESPLKKKSVMFSSTFNATGGTPNAFGSNGLPKSEAAGAGGLTASNASNIFAHLSQQQSIAASKATTMVNNVQPPSFAVASKLETSAENKNLSSSSNLFLNSAAPVFGVSSTQPGAGANSVFGGFPAAAADGGFASKKTESQLVTSSTGGGAVGFSVAAPTFSFGNNATTVTTAAAAVTSSQLTSGGFSFNGPKAADGNSGSQNYVFGAVGNATATANTNNGGSGTGGLYFNFNAQPATIPNAGEQSNQQQRPIMNSVFAPAAVKAQPELQQMANSTSVFGNNVFATAAHQQQQPSTVNPIKKSGGFSFPTPATNQFSAPSVNSFSSFAAPAADSQQDQNRVNSGTAPASSPFVFGAQNQNTQSHNFNLTVPATFNFTGGNTCPSFSAQPTAGSTGTTSLGPRRIKKAVRRTAK